MWARLWLGGMFVVLVSTTLLTSACEKSPFESDRPVPGDPAAAPPRSHLAANSALYLDGGVVLERSDPPPPAGDLREEVTRFTTLDACVAQHAVLDPLVGDAVRSIGYDTLLRDACRILEAIKLKDNSPCSVITASSLARRCESLVAIALQDAERCPWELSSQKQRGRDATCLAISTRDPRVCAAAGEGAQPACEALASGDGSRCARASATERAACTRDLERYRSLLAGEHDAHDAHDTTAPRAHLEIHGSGATPSPSDYDLSSSVVGGAVVAAEAVGGASIELARDLESVLGLPTRIERAHLAASVAFEAGVPKLTKLSLVVPRVGEFTCPSPHCALTVTMPKADPKRGAPLTATIEGTVETPTGSYQTKVQIDTFVRDVVGRMAIYGGR